MQDGTQKDIQAAAEGTGKIEVRKVPGEKKRKEKGTLMLKSKYVSIAAFFVFCFLAVDTILDMRNRTGQARNFRIVSVVCFIVGAGLVLRGMLKQRKS